MRRNKEQVTIYFILFSLILIGVVYAILQANLQINGIAKIKSNTWDIHFDNIQINSNSVSIGDDDSAATIDPNDTSKVDFSVTLSTPGDFYEFTVDVVNAGTIDGMIELLTQEMKVNNEVVQKTPNYLNYIVTYEDDSSILLKHLLEAGETLTYKVRLEFKTDIEELPEAATINSSFGVQFVQADDTAIKKRPYYACTFDGDLVQGAEYTNGQYTYRYMQEYGTWNSSSQSYEWRNIDNDGWGVHLSDTSSTDSVTSRLCTSINDKPIVSMSYMFYESKSTSVDTTSFNTSNVTNMINMFNGCSSLTDIDVTKFDTSNVTNMINMFNGCSSLTDIDVTKFDTSNVTNMFGMFANCSNLNDIDVTEFDTSNVTNMSGMFANCSNLNDIDVTEFDTSKVTNMNGMFSNCSNLNDIDVTEFDTSNVTNMGGMFSGCSSLTELDLSGFDLRGASSFGAIAGNIFYGTSSLKKLNLSNMKLPPDMSHAIFRSGAASSSPIEEIDVTGWDLSNTTNVSGMLGSYGSNGFGGTGLKRIIGLDTWDTSHITNMSYMFQGLSSLTTLDLSSFNTSNVTNTDNMFDGCTSVTTAYGRTNSDITKFNASSNKPSNITFIPKP
ncbi:MAG: BspA family leucine-rich repeat surface protein [Bacilli bacterium]|nr:BspA family leucine-rich repeat surface protein [Bacilli bacterium]